MGIMYKLMKHRHFSMDLSIPAQDFENHSNIKTDPKPLITIEGKIIETPTSQSMQSEEDSLSRNMDSNVDKQFTAEHIIQLCKFLAEKSKRNKNLYKQQQSPKKLNKSKSTQFQFQQMEYDDHDGNDDSEEINKDIEFYQNEALPLLTRQHQREQRKSNSAHNEFQIEQQEQQHKQKTTGILSSRLSPDINSLNISSNTLTSTSALQNYQRHQVHQPQPEQQLSQQDHEHGHHQLFNYQFHEQQQQHIQGKRDILLKIRRQIFERKRLRGENGAFEEQQFLNATQVWRPW